MKRKVRFYPRLYLGEGVKNTQKDKLKKKLIYKPLLSGLYVVVFSQNDSDLLEFFDAAQLTWGFYEKNPVMVIGIAGDYEDALRLVTRIVQECLDVRGDCRLKEYLIC